MSQYSTANQVNSYISTGYKLFDSYLGGGFSKASLTTVTALAGARTTSFGLSLTLNAIKKDKRVVYYSVHAQSPKQLFERMKEMITGMSGSEQMEMNKSMARTKTKIEFVNSADQLFNRLGHLKDTKEPKTDIIIIDSLNGLDSRIDWPYFGCHEILEILKANAKNQSAPVILITKFSPKYFEKKLEPGETKMMPDLVNLKECADVCLRLHKSKYYALTKDRMEVEIDYNKLMPGADPQKFALLFNKRTNYFYECNNEIYPALEGKN